MRRHFLTKKIVQEQYSTYFREYSAKASKVLARCTRLEILKVRVDLSIGLGVNL